MNLRRCQRGTVAAILSSSRSTTPSSLRCEDNSELRSPWHVCASGLLLAAQQFDVTNWSGDSEEAVGSVAVNVEREPSTIFEFYSGDRSQGTTFRSPARCRTQCLHLSVKRVVFPLSVNGTSFRINGRARMPTFSILPNRFEAHKLLLSTLLVTCAPNASPTVADPPERFLSRLN